MKLLLSIIVLSISISSPGMAHIPNEPEVDGREDVICLAVAIQIGGAGGDADQEAANLLAMYFFGKARASMSEERLLEELKDIVPRISGEHWSLERNRCGQELFDAGQMLKRAVGELDSN